MFTFTEDSSNSFEICKDGIKIFSVVSEHDENTVEDCEMLTCIVNALNSKSE